MSDSSPRSVTPLVLEPGPSRLVRLVTFSGFFLALFSFAVLPVPLMLFVPGLILLIAAFGYTWSRHHVLNGHAVMVRLDSDGNWHWQQGGESIPVELLGDSYLMPFLVILNFRTAGKSSPVRALVLTSDNIDADSLRRLRVYLNWHKSSSAGM